MIESIARILAECGTPQAVLPPTEIYNEGWMLRLLLDFLSRHREIDHPLTPLEGARWYSEALLHSRFLPLRRGDPLGEGFTHADAVVGHFRLRDDRGDIEVSRNAKQLIVVEAKLASRLSAGTSRVPDYDQAARNVACLAAVLRDLEPADDMQLGFFVLAPSAQIKAGIFGQLMTKDSIEAKVRARVRQYGELHEAWLNERFLPLLSRIDVQLQSWEEVLKRLPQNEEARALHDFYDLCLSFSPLRSHSEVAVAEKSDR